jgi:hypothetical protein
MALLPFEWIICARRCVTVSPPVMASADEGGFEGGIVAAIAAARGTCCGRTAYR